MISVWKKQFTLKQLSLTHENPITFVISQWQKTDEPNIIYLLYRWVVALTFLVIWILSIIGITEHNDSLEFRAKWLIYLTNWGFTCCTVQAVLVAAILSGCLLAGRRAKSQLQDRVLALYKAYWLSYTIATDLAIGITIVYWSLLYDAEKHMGLDPMNVLVHGINTLIMMIDLFMVSHPIRLLHCVYPCLFGLTYAVFSIIYYAAGGTGRNGQNYIYTILKWEKPSSALITCVGVMSFLIFLHIFHFGMFKVRTLVHRRIYPPAALVENVDLPQGERSAKFGYVNEVVTTETV